VIKTTKTEEKLDTGEIDEYYQKIDRYLNRKFFSNTDRKLCFLLGHYYNYLARKESLILNTNSLYTKLPSYTRRLDREQILKLVDKCNSVVKRLIAKNRSVAKTASHIRRQLHELLMEDQWESSYEELSLAFMMGFSVYLGETEEKTEGGE